MNPFEPEQAEKAAETLAQDSASSPPSPPSETAPPAESESEKKKDKKKKKKKGKDKKDEFRKIDGWERYKALVDTLKESQDLVDLADHKARFALIIMGALNAAILIIATRSDVVDALPKWARPVLYVFLAIYACLAIYFFVQAIESLRPRSIPDVASGATLPEKGGVRGLRFFVDALRYDLQSYIEAWQGVRVSELNAELATQLHTIARINKAKYNAVAKLYLGLRAMTVLVTTLLVSLCVVAAVEQAKGGKRGSSPEDVKLKGGKPKQGGFAVLGEPQRMAGAAPKEASGIASSGAGDTLFVVGDRGNLAEVRADGTRLRDWKPGGNLEDVALHEPSGLLVLLSEKKGELIIFDPARGERARVPMDATGLLGESGDDKNQGFEGLAFRPEAARAGGGVFYLVHQRAPAMVVSIAFDPLAPPALLGESAVVQRFRVGAREDLTGITFDASLDRLLVISDSSDRLSVVTKEGVEEFEVVLPGAQQEGLAFSTLGDLWIADDRAGLFVFRNARARIADIMRADNIQDNQHSSPGPLATPSSSNQVGAKE